MEKHLNTSTSKQAHGFSKSSRFPQLKLATKLVDPATYKIKTGAFDTMRSGDESFRTKEGRFKYYSSHTKQTHHTPASYDSPSSFQKKKEYSMGMSRSKMNPLFVDTIEGFAEKNKNYPSPISYQSKSTLEGLKYSMRPKHLRYGEKEENFSQNYLDR
jgi:hypothetical protein